jgi:hypothetical protein
MKVQLVTNILEGFCKEINEVTIKSTPRETIELLTALNVVESFKNKALEATGHEEYRSDFTMYRFDVDDENNLVTVRIEIGSCG